MKVFKLMFVSLALLAIGVIGYAWWGNRNYFETGQTGRFTINVGETFEFQLPENGSTGYQNCWINQGDCSSVQFVAKEYTSSLQSKLGYIGSGGRVTFELKGISKGFDTLAVAHCPTGIDGKGCSEYSVKSISPDNIFIVYVQ